MAYTSFPPHLIFEIEQGRRSRTLQSSREYAVAPYSPCRPRAAKRLITLRGRAHKTPGRRFFRPGICNTVTERHRTHLRKRMGKHLNEVLSRTSSAVLRTLET